MKTSTLLWRLCNNKDSDSLRLISPRQIATEDSLFVVQGEFMGYFEIGKIAGTHGIKGTLRVFPTTQDPSRFEVLKEVIIDLNGNRETFKILKVSYQKNMVLLTVKEIDDINVAERYKNATILIPEEKALPLGENEYYTRDLYDMEVYTTDNEFLGTITDILSTGANDVYVVKKAEEKELLLPAIKDVILSVSVSEKKMIVNLLEGLR
ncbi:MAG: ribosome maturation factor RimM [Lachnospiraceae bacterium]|nr:ribosome maturation factor RimM [Lachnospiraceae bacterium]